MKRLMTPAIRVENLSKCYRINHAAGTREDYKTLRESLAGAIKAPFKRWTNGSNGHAKNEDFWALKDVSFEVQPGEVVGIIGRNGAGKSTLLKILSRITKPTGGHVTLHGRVGSLLEVGTGFHPELTGRENVYLNGSILGMARREIDRQFDAIVDFSGVEKFLDTPVKRYSSGMYVRLAFAVAAHLNPEILIVDEVLAVGDAEFQRKSLGKMKDVARGGRTVLFVSHNLSAIEQITKTCILMNEGTIATVGETQLVTSRYLERSRLGEVHVSDYRERASCGPHRIIGIQTADNRGELRDIFRPTEPIFVRFQLDVPESSIFDVAFAVEDGKGHPLFASHESDFAEPRYRHGKVALVVSLCPMSLRHGQYLISMGVYSPGLTTRFDEILHMPLFAIEGNTPGFPTDKRWGSFFFPFKWQSEVTQR